MKKINSIKIAVTAAAALLLCTDASAFTMKKKVGDVDTKIKFYGFSQLQAEGGDGTIKDGQGANVKFNAQRIRWGLNYIAGPVRGKLFMDFNELNKPNSNPTDRKDIKDDGVAMPSFIKDAFAAYKFSDEVQAKLGLIKMPHGMSFTIPGWNLDIVERSFDKKLAMERNTGLMISGRDIGFGNNAKVNGLEMGHERPMKGFGYDLQIANQAGRSAAVTKAKSGDANAYAARLHFDWTEALHTELSYAISESAGGYNADATLDTEDYKSLNFGIHSSFDKTDLKFEYYDSENIKGVAGWDESTLAFTATHYVTDTFELAAKHVMASSEKAGVSADLTNTYIGFNLFLEAFDNKMTRNGKRKRNAHKIVANYVVTGGDDGTTGTWNTGAHLGGVLDDKWVIQYQYKY